SQDTSAYGVDVKYAAHRWKDREWRTKFIDLCTGLSELGVWVRLHYVYPYPHVDEVIGLMADRKILPYLDIPFQHASPKVLRAMRRPAHAEKTLERIKGWRRQLPELAIRSTFIAGFPGESEEDFTLLLDFLKEADLDRVGCFAYEPVSGATANDLPGALPLEIREERRDRFMAAAQPISARRLAAKVGQRVKVIVDDSQGRSAKGRTVWDAPEIDGTITLQSRLPMRQGDILTARITGAGVYDLEGTVV
ncbi:MAG: radical SAM protein, partial [Hyphomicrobiaceae bacterium]|nr:radical SAM protein [Hyphomicrobiaceae bacterium]